MHMGMLLLVGFMHHMGLLMGVLCSWSIAILSNIVSKCYSLTDPSVVDIDETNITFP